MQLNFANMFNSGNGEFEIDYHLDLVDFEYSTYKPLTNGADAKGRAYCKADVVYLDLGVDFDFFGICDRCAEEVEKHYSLEINKIIVPKMENDNDDYDNYIVVENNVLDLDDLIYQEIQLFLPQKMLCSEDCRGICQKCGKNLNNGKCDCKKDVDPRMEALLQLLNEE